MEMGGTFNWAFSGEVWFSAFVEFAFKPSPSDDTEDASKCLAILRSVKGEDWTISDCAVRKYNEATDDIDYEVRAWAAHRISTPPHECTTSTISRVHATALAIREKQ